MTPAGTTGLTFAEFVEYASAFGSPIAAAGIWLFGIAMLFQNRSRKEQAAEDRKLAREQAERQAAQAAEDRKAAREQAERQAAAAAEERKVTQGMLAALQELIRRTSPRHHRQQGQVIAPGTLARQAHSALSTFAFNAARWPGAASLSSIASNSERAAVHALSTRTASTIAPA